MTDWVEDDDVTVEQIRAQLDTLERAVVVTPERTKWHKCTNCSFRGLDGRMRPWRGTDGHNGTETFYTCDLCRRTT